MNATAPEPVEEPITDPEPDPARSLELRRKAAANVVRIRAAEELREAETTRDTMETVLRAAEKATGHSREELQRMAAELPPPAPIERPRPRAIEPEDPRARARRRMAAANAPELHIRNLGDRDPIPDQSLDFVLELLAADRGILVLSGAKGTWKTGAGCYALSQVEDGVYVKVEDVLHIAFEDRAKLERVRSASIVLLDEVGGNIPDPKGHLLATLNSWIDWWYGSCARIVITTNLERPGFDALLDARALDRLREVGKFVTLEGDSKRRKQPWGSR